jgi:heptaprenyl diphosphate synthase
VDAIVTRAAAAGLEAPDPTLEFELRGRLDDVEAALEKAVRSDTEFVTEAASYLVQAGGKRFRPMLVLLGGYFGDAADPRLTQGACAIELVHLATLYHDDVVDEARERRGRPSVNAQWGNNVAILTGDFLFARASELAADLGTEVSKLLARTIALLSDGVIREVEGWGRADQSEAAYLEMIRRKTAALIATSCRLGGMLGEAAPETIERLEDFGMSLGMAFQLSDDIMDVISTEEELHKLPGQDMKQGLYTLPVLHALEDVRVADELQGLLASGLPDADAFERALDIVRSDGPLARSREAVSSEVRRAKRLADGLAPGSARDAIIHIGEFLAYRCGAEV